MVRAGRRGAAGERAGSRRARPDLVADALVDGAHPDLLAGASALVTSRVAGKPEALRGNFETATALVGKVAARHPVTRVALAEDMSLSAIEYKKGSGWPSRS